MRKELPLDLKMTLASRGIELHRQTHSTVQIEVLSWIALSISGLSNLRLLAPLIDCMQSERSN
jgi:hypothetical protein